MPNNPIHGYFFGIKDTSTIVSRRPKPCSLPPSFFKNGAADILVPPRRNKAGKIITECRMINEYFPNGISTIR